MDNNQILINAFVDSLRIKDSLVKDELSYNEIPQWDSLAHMTLVAKIEEEFDVMLDTNEILDMSSVKMIKDILTNHGIIF